MRHLCKFVMVALLFVSGTGFAMQAGPDINLDDSSDDDYFEHKWRDGDETRGDESEWDEDENDKPVESSRWSSLSSPSNEERVILIITQVASPSPWSPTMTSPKPPAQNLPKPRAKSSPKPQAKSSSEHMIEARNLDTELHLSPLKRSPKLFSLSPLEWLSKGKILMPRPNQFPALMVELEDYVSDLATEEGSVIVDLEDYVNDLATEEESVSGRLEVVTENTDEEI